MKNKLTELVIKYKKTNSQNILNDIFTELQHIIKKKAEYIYYRKYFPISLYHKCDTCLKCKIKDKKICEKCRKCTCQKGAFNLYKSHLCDYEDVEQDLNLEILRLIQQFNIKKDFKNYLFATLWNWKPSFLTKDFIKNLKTISLYRTDEKGEEFLLEIESPKNSNKKIQLNVQKIIALLDTKTEKKILLNLLSKKKLNQSEIAKKLGITKQAVSSAMKKIRRKLKNHLTLTDFGVYL